MSSQRKQSKSTFSNGRLSTRIRKRKAKREKSLMQTLIIPSNSILSREYLLSKKEKIPKCMIHLVKLRSPSLRSSYLTSMPRRLAITRFLEMWSKSSWAKTIRSMLWAKTSSPSSKSTPTTKTDWKRNTNWKYQSPLFTLWATTSSWRRRIPS